MADTFNVAAAVGELRELHVRELQERYEEVHGEPPRSGNRDFLIKRITWRLQAIHDGDLSERARRRAAEIASDADLRLNAPRESESAIAINRALVGAAFKKPSTVPFAPGTMITRHYKGQLISVKVLERGFEFEGRTYRSLTAIATKVTGSHWNGHLFFRIKDAPGRGAA